MLLFVIWLDSLVSGLEHPYIRSEMTNDSLQTEKKKQKKKVATHPAKITTTTSVSLKIDYFSQQQSSLDNAIISSLICDFSGQINYQRHTNNQTFIKTQKKRPIPTQMASVVSCEISSLARTVGIVCGCAAAVRATACCIHRSQIDSLRYPPQLSAHVRPRFLASFG